MKSIEKETNEKVQFRNLLKIKYFFETSFNRVFGLNYTELNYCSRYEEVLIWKDGGRIPPLFVQGSAVTDLKLIEPPRVEKLRLGKIDKSHKKKIYLNLIFLKSDFLILSVSGLADLKGEIADLANTSLSPEQGKTNANSTELI